MTGEGPQMAVNTRTCASSATAAPPPLDPAPFMPPAYLTGAMVRRPGAFGCFPRAPFADPDLPAQAKVLLAVLVSWLPDRGTHVLRSDDQLADETGMPERTVRFWRTRLRQAGLLLWKRRLKGCNSYYFIDGRQALADPATQEATVGKGLPTMTGKGLPVQTGKGLPTRTGKGLPTLKGQEDQEKARAARLGDQPPRPETDGNKTGAQWNPRAAREARYAAEAAERRTWTAEVPVSRIGSTLRAALTRPRTAPADSADVGAAL